MTSLCRFSSRPVASPAVGSQNLIVLMCVCWSRLSTGRRRKQTVRPCMALERFDVILIGGSLMCLLHPDPWPHPTPLSTLPSSTLPPSGLKACSWYQTRTFSDGGTPSFVYSAPLNPHPVPWPPVACLRGGCLVSRLLVPSSKTGAAGGMREGGWEREEECVVVEKKNPVWLLKTIMRDVQECSKMSKS